MTVFPVNMSHEHNALPPVESLGDHRNLHSIAAFAIFLALLVVGIRSILKRLKGQDTEHLVQVNRGMRILIGVFLFSFCYLPASHVSDVVLSVACRSLGSRAAGAPDQVLLDVGFLLAERSLFLPSLGTAILLTEAIVFIAERYAETMVGMKGQQGAKYAAFITVAALALSYGQVTWKRSAEWANEEALLTSNLSIYPYNNPMSYYGLG